MIWFPIWPILHFLTFSIYILIAAYIISRTSRVSKNPFKITAAAIFLTFAVWSFGTIFLHNPGTPYGIAVVFNSIVSVSWIVFPSLALLLFTFQTANKKLLNSWLFRAALVLFPSLCIFLFLSGRLTMPPEKTYYGWYSQWVKASFWPFLYYSYYLGFISWGTFIFISAARRSDSKDLKNQARIIGLSTLAALLIGTFMDIIGPNFFYNGNSSPFGSMADIYISIWAAAVLYSIIKYNMYSLTPATASESIISNMSESLFLMNDDLKIIYANAAAHSLLKYDKNKLFSMNFVSLLKRKNDINAILKASLKQNSISGFETALIGKTGSPVPVILSFNTLLESNDIIGFSCMVTDITDIKVAEFRLKHERDRAQKYLDTAEVMFLALDREHRITLINKKGGEILGYTEKEALGADWIDKFIPEEYKKDMLDVFSRIISENSVLGDFENHIITKNGKRRLIKWSNTLLKTDTGVVTGVLSAGVDITDQALIQEQIKKLSIAVEQSPSSIVITDMDVNITYVNPKFCEITGYSKEEVLGKNPRFQQSGEWPKEKYMELWDTITSGRQWRGVFHNKKKNGELYWESASISPIKDYKNSIYGYIAIKEDITAQKKAEDELQQSYEKLKELDTMKTNFTSMVSHELRTPLTSIKGFLSLLLAGAAGKLLPEQKDFVEAIRNNSDRLLNLINEILDMSKMESGNFLLEKKDCSIHELAESSINDIKPLAARKHISVQVESTVESPRIIADPYRLTQVFINLISNSIKFSAENSTIHVRIGPAAPGKIIFPAHFPRPDVTPSGVYVTVTDTGIGISKQDLPKIFTRYYQTGNINTRRFQGTGLGLSIAKNIIEAHGGLIWVDSDGERKGSVFSFILPA